MSAPAPCFMYIDKSMKSIIPYSHRPASMYCRHNHRACLLLLRVVYDLLTVFEHQNMHKHPAASAAQFDLAISKCYLNKPPY